MKEGLYRNHLGAEMTVLDSITARSTFGANCLGEGSALATSRDSLLGTTTLWIVSEADLRSAGYERAEAGESRG